MWKNVIVFLTNLWYDLIKIWGVKMRGKYGALYIAKYLICKFNIENKNITQLKLQKLLYFIEAYYMAYYNKDALYKEDFYAWTYGPVIKEVYDKYKVYMSDSIIDDDFVNPFDIDKDVRNSIDIICNAFGSLTAYDLIKITHRQGSPWYHTFKQKKISKEETKEWFKQLFLTGNERNG